MVEKRLLTSFAVTIAFLSGSALATVTARGAQRPAKAALEFAALADWPRLPSGRTKLGQMHGDVAVSSKGEVYVSTEDPAAPLQVYAPDGTFLRNLSGAPSDFHGFVIRRQPDGEFIFGASLLGQQIIKMTLDGKILTTISTSSIPDKFKWRNAPSPEKLLPTGIFQFYKLPADDPRRKADFLLTGLDVAPNGDIYATDGYANDYVHRFDRAGKYLGSFGGRDEPYTFRTFHKLLIDTRFQPARILGCDRANNRLVHLSLDGTLMGVVATDLLLPAALALSGDNVVVGEFQGRVTVLDKAGRVVTHFGTNTEQSAGVAGYNVPPDKWQSGVVLAPHGVAVNSTGDVFVSEFSAFGRVHRFNKR
jgi:hypothetical protein